MLGLMTYFRFVKLRDIVYVRFDESIRSTRRLMLSVEQQHTAFIRLNLLLDSTCQQLYPCAILPHSIWHGIFSLLFLLTLLYISRFGDKPKFKSNFAKNRPRNSKMGWIFIVVFAELHGEKLDRN